MGQGNPNKVNAIVDEIVKSNSVFKLKSPIEQDKEKDSMARSINSALSVLNEIGKELVLQDLSVDPDEKFKGFIDSVGNIDISGLTKMTATIVKAKIEEAEREGLNLRTGEPVFKNDNKISVVEGVLTVAVIDTMIKNYGSLSEKDRYDLLNHYEELSDEQKNDINNAQNELAQETLKNWEDILNNLNCSEEEKDKAQKEIARLRKLIKRNRDANRRRTIRHKLENGEEISNEDKEYYIRYFKEKINNSNKKEHIIIYLKVLFKDFPEEAGLILRELDKKGISIDISELSFNEQTEKDFLGLENKEEKEEVLRSQETIDASKKNFEAFKGKQYEKAFQEIPLNEQSITMDQFIKLEDSEKLEYLHTNSSTYKENQSTESKEAALTPSLSNSEKSITDEIEQLPITLAKDGFSQEEIKEALKIYVDFVKEIDDEVIEDFKTKDEKELIGFVEEYFSEYKEQLAPKSFEVLEILASNTFGGHLQQILTTPQLLQETFLPALSAEIEKLEQQPIQDEHTDEYYRSQSETLQVDEEFEKIVKEIQAQGGGVKEITVALAKKVEERATEQSQHSFPEKESKEQKPEQPTPPIFENPTTPEEPTQESATSPEQETLEETGQNMAMVKQDNSFIGKIRRVFANMRDMKNKDNSKGFFARLGASIKTVFGNKEELYEEQDSTSTSPTTENQSQSTARREPIDYLNQHFEVNESIARKETEKSKEAKDFSNAGDRTTDEEEK